MEKQRSALIGAITFAFAVALAACGGAVQSATPRPAPASFEEYAVAACAAWDALFRAVGNPDTGSGSELSRSLDQAVGADDTASADRLAQDIGRELATGRAHVAVAGGWAPRTAVMVQLDGVFAAYEAMIQAKRAAARPDYSGIDPQAAFEQAGGLEAWFKMIEAMRAAGLGAAGERQCANGLVAP